MKRIVITGGPQAGKTTVMSALKQEHSDRIVFVPEPATMLFNEGYPLPREDVAYTRQWQQMFQNIITPLHLGLEWNYEQLARQRGIELMICDRGILDGAAYYPGGIDPFLSVYHLRLKDCFDRYVQIIHLESTAVCNPEIYGKTGNE